MLKFWTYFVEDVISERIENERIRKCIMFYYLEDDSIQLVEPKTGNSGIPQGTFLRRHKIPFQPLPEDDVAPDELPRPSPRMTKDPNITFWDLNLQKDLMIYGRRHTIVNCDQFTRNYLTAQGVEVKAAQPEPEDKFTEHRTKIEAVNPYRPYKRPKTPRRFEANEPKVLRFYGLWLDKTISSKPGAVEATEARKLIVYFHLEDETIEVAEDHDVNCGRYKAPLFLKRSKIPKDVKNLVTLPGMHTDHTLLNVVRSRGPGRVRDAIVIDNLETRATPSYHPETLPKSKMPPTTFIQKTSRLD